MLATRRTTLRDFLIFQLKLVLDGLKDVFVFNLSILAVLVDLVGGGRRRRYFYSVMRASERFDLWLNLHHSSLEAEAHRDGLFGVSRAGSDTFVGTLEKWVRGGDEPDEEG